MEQKTGLT